MDKNNMQSPFGSNEAVNDISETPSNNQNVSLECPVCCSLVRLYFINYEEQFLMCSNVECDYPFGYQEIKLYNCNDIRTTEETSSSKGMTIPSNTPSTVSSQAWADIEQMNKVYEADDCQSDLRSMKEYKDKSLKKLVEIESQERLVKNMQNIKELNVALSDVTEHKGHCLSNAKWLKHLLNMQKMSGQKLLRRGELTTLSKVSPTDSKLKIDIGSSKNNGSSITIKMAE